MSYIGNQPYQVAFVSDSFNGTGSQTVFTMSVAPANTASVLVVISGVLQDPSTYSVSGTTLTFSAAPPSGTANISARYLGIPASGVTTTAYRTVTEFTATAGQTTFTPPSYTAGFINVFQSGVLLGSADYTATNGTTVVLTTGAPSGSLITIESFNVSSVLNAIPNQSGSVNDNNINTVSASKLTGSRTIPKGTMPTGAVLQVVQGSTSSGTSVSAGSAYTATNLTASITPTNSSSKVLILVNGQMYLSSGTGEPQGTIYRNGSNLISAGSQMTDTFSASGAMASNVSCLYLDSPSTTSSTTYTFYFKTSTSGTATFPVNGGTATIVLMEIAA